MSSKHKKTGAPSVDGIKQVFIKINDQIKSLHDYSNKDFYALNDNFKNNFDASTKIFNNSKLLMALFKENSSFHILDDFKNFKKRVINFYIHFKEIITESLQNFDTLENSGNSLKIFLNNVNQDLLTYNFLISNYNLFQTSKTQYSSNIQNLVQKIKCHIDKLINDTDQLINKINLLEQKCEEIIEYINIAQEGLNTELEESYKLLNAKKEETKKKIGEIENKGELSQNINDIITNLQYHDILRQKMEHIQKIHHDVIDKLQQFEITVNNKNGQGQIAGRLVYIKEIAELQSAQLIHVNKKYQVAIKIISDNIYKIGENANSINMISQDILGYSSKNNSNFLFNISFTIDNIYKKFLEILYLFIEITSSQKQFKNLQSEFIYEFDNINKFYVDFKNTSKEFISVLLEDEAQNMAIIKQFGSISEEIINLKTEINNSINITTELLFNLYSNSKPGQLIDDIQNNFLGFADGFVQKFKIRSLEANQKLIDNRNISRSINSSIQQSLDQVRYYEYFEKVIEEITLELNNLNETISSSIKIRLKNKNVKLGQLKKHYTTGSEHDIHNLFIEKGKAQSETYEETREGDNIEFF